MRFAMPVDAVSTTAPIAAPTAAKAKYDGAPFRLSVGTLLKVREMK